VTDDSDHMCRQTTDTSFIVESVQRQCYSLYFMSNGGTQRVSHPGKRGPEGWQAETSWWTYRREQSVERWITGVSLPVAIVVAAKPARPTLRSFAAESTGRSNACTPPIGSALRA
jgi:hypothetical protein